MKSNVIALNKDTYTIQSILNETEKVAVYTGLQGKEVLHLRLLSEEICCMVDVLVQDFSGEFWIESEEKNYSLFVSLNTDLMNLELKEELLRASTTGKNALAKGFVGRIRSLVENFALMSDGSVINMYGFDVNPENMIYSSAWLYSQYKVDIQKASEPVIWDELEKSILAKLADEVIVGVKGRKIEIVVKKAF